MASRSGVVDEVRPSLASLEEAAGPSQDATAADSQIPLARPDDRSVTFALEDTHSRYEGRHARSPGRRTAGAEASPTLTVHLLGKLRVMLNGVSVSDWPSRRGRSVFKYLLTHRNPWPSREMLMEAFWPNAVPESARNNLNVAVHGLRRALRAAADVPVVVLDGGTYRLHPDVHLWLDVDEFEHCVGRWRELEASGDLAGATTEYELAASLYQGDFLADDPYEEWPVLARERLQLAYLDTLGRLSYLYFSHAQYGTCAVLCQRIIELDPCREDAHRRLMHCYSRQDQPQLALRLYWVCVEALRDELGIEVSPATVELHERIRRREPV
jgi:DNA-binding SARP family transcriptional activator